jgi:hypothetical protein
MNLNQPCCNCTGRKKNFAIYLQKNTIRYARLTTVDF